MRLRFLALLILAGCNGRPNGTMGPPTDDDPPSTVGFGRIEVTVLATGGKPGATYTITISNGQKRSVGANEAVVFTTVRVGTHEIALSSPPAGCMLAETNPQIVLLHQSETRSVYFTLTCDSQG